MRAKKLNITFHAQDFDASVAFYQNILGLSYLHGWDRPDGRGAFFALNDEAELEFFGAPRGEAQKNPAPQDMRLALMVEDVDAEYLRLKDKLPLFDELAYRPWGDKSFGIIDPNGVIIYIFQRFTSLGTKADEQ